MVDCFDLFWSSRRELSRENEGHGQAGKSMYGRVEDSALQGGMLKKQDADEVDEKGRWKIRERTLSCPSIAVIEGFICILIRPARTRGERRHEKSGRHAPLPSTRIRGRSLVLNASFFDDVMYYASAWECRHAKIQFKIVICGPSFVLPLFCLRAKVKRRV
jgi:hypothetical protein